MTTFTTRHIGGPRLQEVLRAAREALSLSRAEVAERSRVPERFLVAFEEGTEGVLPDALYQNHFLRSLAKTLSLDARALCTLAEEERSQHARVAPRVRRMRALERFLTTLSPRETRMLVFLVLSGVVLCVLAWELIRVSTPPALTLVSPAQDTVTTSSTVQLIGRTEPESLLTVNGEPVYLQGDGGFVDEVYLHRGVNLITIAAKKPHSDERVLYRRVVWDQAPDGGEAPAPATH